MEQQVNCMYCHEVMSLHDEDGDYKIFSCKCGSEVIMDGKEEEWAAPANMDTRIKQIHEIIKPKKAIFGNISLRLIPKEIIEKYNLQIGQVTPFGHQMIVQ